MYVYMAMCLCQQYLSIFMYVCSCVSDVCMYVCMYVLLYYIAVMIYSYAVYTLSYQSLMGAQISLVVVAFSAFLGVMVRLWKSGQNCFDLLVILTYIRVFFLVCFFKGCSGFAHYTTMAGKKKRTIRYRSKERFLSKCLWVGVEVGEFIYHFG